jgi:hypothetical protein
MDSLITGVIMLTPTMLYKYPGKHEIHGSTFDYIIVDESEIDDALKLGWHRSTDEAKNNSPASRSELEIKAGELGIKFDGRTSDRKLEDLISTALSAENGMD